MTNPVLLIRQDFCQSAAIWQNENRIVSKSEFASRSTSDRAFQGTLGDEDVAGRARHRDGASKPRAALAIGDLRKERKNETTVFLIVCVFSREPRRAHTRGAIKGIDL
jgi:hypothetical protein